MGDWQGWANSMANNYGATGAAIYNKTTGDILTCCNFAIEPCNGCLKFDEKGQGNSTIVSPKVNGTEGFVFLRQTMEDDPAFFFKKNAKSFLTMKGPVAGYRIALFIGEGKPETVYNKAVKEVDKC